MRLSIGVIVSTRCNSCIYLTAAWALRGNQSRCGAQTGMLALKTQYIPGVDQYRNAHDISEYNGTPFLA